MYRFILPLVTFAASLHGGFSATIQLSAVTAEEDLKNNLVGYESDSVEGLTPPIVEAKNYFSSQLGKSIPNFYSENSYVVEIHGNYLSIKTAGLPSQKIKLNKTESEGIKKLSISFVQLLNSSKLSSQQSEKEKKTEWEDANPVITISNSGVFLQFLNPGALKREANASEISTEHRQVLWNFLRKYTSNIFEEKLKQLKVTEKYADVLDSPVDDSSDSGFQNFLNFLWNILKVSVDYAETAFNGWTTSTPEERAPENDRKIRSSTVTLFAYEEPSPFHEFPSQEFLNRRKDLDSIFYGRGVI